MLNSANNYAKIILKEPPHDIFLWPIISYSSIVNCMWSKQYDVQVYVLQKYRHCQFRERSDNFQVLQRSHSIRLCSINDVLNLTLAIALPYLTLS